MSPLEPRSLTIAGSKYSNIIEAQEKDLKTTFMTMIEDLNRKVIFF